MTTTPRAPIRRFDVFAEYNRQKAMQDGMPEDKAEGHGLWLAKVVASRGFGRGVGPKPPKQADGAHGNSDEEEKPEEKWRTLDGKPQTDEMFHQEIVSRMGKEFYEEVFRPALEEAFREGRTYTSIRDTIRKDWKPRRAGEVR